MSVSGSGFEAGLGREEQSRFTRRLPSRKSVVAATHSRTTPASADLHPAGNDRQAAGPTALLRVWTTSQLGGLAEEGAPLETVQGGGNTSQQSLLHSARQ